MPRFTPTRPDALGDNVFKLIGDDWMLVTAGTREDFNTMTASWGGMGVLWNRPVATCYVRPSRHTYGFMERHDLFSLCFFEERYRDALTFCGTHSGRDTDKPAATGLTPAGPAGGPVHFEQARIVLVCRKLYFDDLRPDRFLDPAIGGLYAAHEYHRFYIGELTEVLQRGDAL